MQLHAVGRLSGVPGTSISDWRLALGVRGGYSSYSLDSLDSLDSIGSIGSIPVVFLSSSAVGVFRISEFGVGDSLLLGFKPG